jgi:hypothetical protein
MKFIITILTLLTFSLSAQVKIPGRVEAENYSSFKLAVINSNADAKYVTFETNSWASYKISVPKAGRFAFSIRLADGSGGANNSIRKSDGTVLASFVTPATGSLTTFATIIDTVTLAAGSQTFRVVDISGEYNLDYIDISPIADVVPPTPATVSQADFDALKTRVDTLQAWFLNNNIKFSKKFMRNSDGDIDIKQDTLLAIPYKRK